MILKKIWRLEMNKINKYNENTFESIKHINENGIEYWDARELMPILEYSKWENFHKVIKTAMIACETSNNNVKDCFPEVRKPIISGKGRTSYIVDYHLSRYACYLIVQNANPKKESVALGQTYFAVQTRKQEITELEYSNMSEDEKRFYQRNLTKKGNYSLNRTAVKIGVKNLDKFHNAGYKGLYNGETANDIAKRKKLNYREDILDNMGSVELAANLFRITQTEQKLINDNIQTEKDANDAHYEVGKNIREVIAKNGGTMPEKLPTPKKSLKELEKEKIELNKITS
jgi:DNA-damage-inducible protein D